MKLPKTILVATDFSESSERALDYAVALAAKLGAKVHVVNAIAIPSVSVPEVAVVMTASMIDSMVKTSQAELDRMIKSRAPTAIDTVLRTGDPRDVIVGTAVELGADLIITGSHGRRGIRRMLLGSVAEAVLRHAPCPVLIVRENVEGGR